MRISVVIFILLIFSCGKESKALNPVLQKNKHNSKLVKVDRNNKQYADVHNDIITPDGWAIEYLVKDDSTRHENLFINWKKDSINRIFEMQGVLNLRSYFIPLFKKETKTHIYFEHGCATGCMAITVLPKHKNAKPKTFSNVYDYSTEKGIILYTPHRSYSLDTLEMEGYNLHLNRSASVKFTHTCKYTPEDSCIEKAIFKDNTIAVYGSFNDKNGNIVKETRTIEF